MLPSTLHQSQGIVEPLVARAMSLFRQYRVCILATLVAGLAAHLFFLSHKLVTFDDSLFTYGQTFSSGRWGLGIIKLLVPPFSMPWLHGLASLAIMSLAMVTVVKLYGIGNTVAQALLPAVVITSALHTSIFLFMFTSTPYALAILLAILATYYVLRPGRKAFVLGVLCLTLSLSIYQVYITLAVALLLVALCRRLLSPRAITRTDVLHWSARIGLFLLSSLVVYFAVAMAIIAMKGGLGASHYDYAVSTGNHVPWSEHVTGVFTNFVALFTHGKLGLINTPLSVVLHLVLIVTMVLTVLHRQYRQGSRWRLAAQAVILLVGFPVTIHLFWLMLAPAHWNTLTVYAFAALYVLGVVLIDRQCRRWFYDTIAICLAGIALNNIYYDNRTYLQVHQLNVNNLAFYTGLATHIKLMPELRPGTSLALIGHAHELVYDTDTGFGFNEIRGASKLINSYSRRDYIIRQVGFNIPIWRRDDPEQLRLEGDPRVKAMPVYPYRGSIQAIDSVIVVKLGEP